MESGRRFDAASDRARHAPRDCRLHVAGTGARGARRFAFRHLFVRLRPVRDAVRQGGRSRATVGSKHSTRFSKSTRPISRASARTCRRRSIASSGAVWKKRRRADSRTRATSCSRSRRWPTARSVARRQRRPPLHRRAAASGRPRQSLPASPSQVPVRSGGVRCAIGPRSNQRPRRQRPSSADLSSPCCRSRTSPAAAKGISRRA